MKFLASLAPHLAESQHVLIADMNASKIPFKAEQIAKVAGCSPRSIHRTRSEMQGSTPLFFTSGKQITSRIIMYL